MTNILQISDTHLAADNVLVSGRLETDLSFKKLVDRLLNARDQWGVIDAILITGDISDDGSEESYTRFKSLIAPLNLPIFVIPGNHDVRDTMRHAFLHDSYFPKSGPLNWNKRIGDVNVIGLDTLVEGDGYGVLASETLEFLEAQLNAAKQQPVLLALHHPPFKTGIAFMDKIGLQNTDEFVSVLTRAHCEEVRVICGHIHSSFVTSVAGHVTMSCASPCSNFELDLRGEDAVAGYYDREDGCILHRWEHGFQSIHIAPNSGAGPHLFG